MSSFWAFEIGMGTGSWSRSCTFSHMEHKDFGGDTERNVDLQNGKQRRKRPGMVGTM